MKLQNGFTKKKLMIGDNVTERNHVPRWRIERIAEELKGEVKYYTCCHSNKKVFKKIVITYEES